MPRRASSSGSTTGVAPSAIELAQAADGLGGDDDAFELGEDTFGRDVTHRGGLGARGGAGLGIGLEVQLARQPRGPQDPQRVGREGLRADHAQAPGGEVGAPAEGVDRLSPGQRLGDRVDGEVARGQVGFDAVAVDRQQVDLPAMVARHDAPDAERVRQREGGGPSGATQRLGRLLRRPVHDHVEVEGLPPEQAVAHGAADQPGAAAVQRLTGEGERVAVRRHRGGSGARPGRSGRT